MKQCPQCGREYDNSMMFCLDDGAELLYGPGLSEPGAVATGFRVDEPQTAILHSTAVPSEAPTRAKIKTTDQTAVFASNAEAECQKSSDDSTEKQSLSANRARKPLIAVVLAVLLLVSGFFGFLYFNAGDSDQVNSIAVLPFENRSGTTDTEYLSDGLADSLIYRLSQLPNLKVSPTSSVMRYKGKGTDTSQIAKELNVDAVMSGRLVQIGENLNISIQLTDARTDKLIWAEQYDRKMSDLLATQREIATTIADKLQLKLSGDEATGITKNYTNSNDAYQLYLKGRYQWNKRTAESLKLAVDFYDQAIEKDPAFALAYSGLAESYVLYSNYDVALPKHSMPQAKAAALRALELDDSLAEAYTALGFYRCLYEHDLPGGEKDLRRAIELNPSYATARQWLGQMLVHSKRFEEGNAEIRRALEVDPLSPIVRFNAASNLYLARRYDDALKEFQSTAAIYPDFPHMPTGMCWATFARGEVEQAIPLCRKALELVPEAYNKGYLALVLGSAGQRDEARRLLNELEAESSKREVPSIAFALAHLGLDQKEPALNMLEKEVDDRGYSATSLAVLPEVDRLRSEPRFKALIKRMNLPE